MSIEAMKLMDALEEAWRGGYENDIEASMHDLRQAIEQAQKNEVRSQEPLCTAAMFDDAFLAKSGMSPDTKLYTSPPQRQPLTDEQKKDLFKEWFEKRGVWPRLTYEEVFLAGMSATHGITGEQK